MELLLRLAADADQRLTGTIRRCDDGTVAAFSGRLELLACLERLCLEHLQLEQQHPGQHCRDRPEPDRTTAEPHPTT